MVNQAKKLIYKSKIMMVDDEPLNMQILRLHLESEGYECIVTLSDSTQTISALRTERPSVLLLDLHMPEVSGMDILKLMRTDEQLSQLPVIVLTSSNDPTAKLQALQLGATDFLSKPVDPSELALRLGNTIAARAHNQRLMNFDNLTDLPNRVYFGKVVNSLISVCSGNKSKTSLILINLDSLKSIRDSYGIDRADDLLQGFSKRALKVFEQNIQSQPCLQGGKAVVHCFARVAGDRFGVLISCGQGNLGDQPELIVINELLSSLEVPFSVDGQDVFTTVSIGVSELNGNTSNADQLVDQAETAMLHAQNSHNISYAHYGPEMVELALRKLKIENGLRTAVVNNEMHIVYQPKVDIETGAIEGAEALIRWQHPELGALSPLEFISIAESTGLIIGVGQWILDQACHQAFAIQQMGYKNFRMAVNVSIRQLNETHFVARVKNALLQSGLAPQHLIVELTENIFMDDTELSIKLLKQLKNIGVKISIDDFGTGYSSLSYLHSFPIDQLKIDQSFIKEIYSADDVAPIVKSIISLAHDLELEVVAEGVETKEQLARLTQLKCEQYQGYYKSRPVSGEKFIELLTAENRKVA